METGHSEEMALPTIVDLRNKIEGIGHPSLIKVDSSLVATRLWGEMIDQTQGDGLERGVVVSVNRSGNTLTSGIFVENTQEDVLGRLYTPLLPHGIRGFLSGTHSVTMVHTHFMPPEVDHIETSYFSGTDVGNFASSQFNALVMLDRGGAHLLLKKEQAHSTPVNGIEIVDTAFAEAKKRGENRSRTVRKIMAERLLPYGMLYYYTPDIAPASDNGVVFRHSRLP